MTLAMLLAQLQQVVLTHGAEMPLHVVLVDPETHAEHQHAVQVEIRIGPDGKRYCALVPLVPVVRAS